MAHDDRRGPTQEEQQQALRALQRVQKLLNVADHLGVLCGTLARLFLTGAGVLFFSGVALRGGAALEGAELDTGMLVIGGLLLLLLGAAFAHTEKYCERKVEVLKEEYGRLLQVARWMRR